MENNFLQEDIDKLYDKFNKVYGKLIMKKFPYIFKVEIDKESFNELVNAEPGIFGINLIVHICAKYNSPEYDIYGGYGNHTNYIINQVRLLLADPLLEGKLIFPNSLSNEKEYCNG